MLVKKVLFSIFGLTK